MGTKGHWVPRAVGVLALPTPLSPTTGQKNLDPNRRAVQRRTGRVTASHLPERT